MTRLSFEDSRRHDPQYDGRDPQMLKRRRLWRPFWLNVVRQHWPYRHRDHGLRHWQLYSHGMTSPCYAPTARIAYCKWHKTRRYWMRRAPPSPQGQTEEPGVMGELLMGAAIFALGLAAIKCAELAWWLSTPSGKRWWERNQERLKKNRELCEWACAPPSPQGDRQ